MADKSSVQGATGVQGATRVEGASGVEGAHGLDGARGLGASGQSYGPKRREPHPTTEAVPLPFRQDPPFYCRLVFDPGLSHAVGDQTVPASSFAVTVANGVVGEHLTGSGEDEEALDHHFCPGRLTDGRLTEFPIEVGQAIFVRVYCNEYGVIGLPDGVAPNTEKVDLVVADKDTKSLNYIPQKQNGVYYYKLAEFLSEDGSYFLKHFRSGSNIEHYSGLTCDAVLRDCAGDLNTKGAIIQRLSFNRGFMVALNAAEADRPLAPNTAEENISPCT